MAAINTKDDWWRELTVHKDQLKETLLKTHTPDQEFDLFDKSIERKDHAKCHEILEDAWVRAPDSPVIHSWPAWNVLCNLCSEYWVFEDDQDNMEDENDSDDEATS